MSSARDIILNNCYDLAHNLIGNFVAKDTFDQEDQNLYIQLVEKKKRLVSSLFFNVSQSMELLYPNSTLDQAERNNLAIITETINLATFVFNLFNNSEYGTCIGSFFQSVTFSTEKLSAEEVQFYVDVRTIWLVQALKAGGDLKTVLDECFPTEDSGFHFVPDRINYTIISAVKLRRNNLKDQNKDAIIALQKGLVQFNKELQDFARRRFTILLNAKQTHPKRVAEVLSNQTVKKAKTTADNMKKAQKGQFDDLSDSDSNSNSNSNSDSDSDSGSDNEAGTNSDTDSIYHDAAVSDVVKADIKKEDIIEAMADALQEVLVKAHSAEATHPEATSIEATSIEVTSVEATSVEATSVEATHVRATSVEATSVEATHVRATSVEAIHVEANSVEAIPVEATSVAIPVEATPTDAIMWVYSSSDEDMRQDTNSREDAVTKNEVQAEGEDVYELIDSEDDTQPVAAASTSTQRLLRPVRSTPVAGPSIADNDLNTGDNLLYMERFTSRSASRPKKVKVRKEKVPWTRAETLALEEALEEFKKPVWAEMKNAYGALCNRDSVAIKDKARNMYRKLEREGVEEWDDFGPYRFYKPKPKKS